MGLMETVGIREEHADSHRSHKPGKTASRRQGMRLAHPARILYFGICERPEQEAEKQDAAKDYSKSGP
jgi:hypothetical protein